MRSPSIFRTGSASLASKVELAKGQFLVEKLLGLAFKVNLYCIKMVFEYLDEHPVQMVEKKDEGNIIHSHEFDRFRSMLMWLADKYSMIRQEPILNAPVVRILFDFCMQLGKSKSVALDVIFWQLYYTTPFQDYRLV